MAFKECTTTQLQNDTHRLDYKHLATLVPLVVQGWMVALQRVHPIERGEYTQIWVASMLICSQTSYIYLYTPTMMHIIPRRDQANMYLQVQVYCTCHQNIIIHALFQYWHCLSIFTVHIFTQTHNSCTYSIIPHAVWATVMLPWQPQPVEFYVQPMLYICITLPIHTQRLTINISPH